jgi:outer membrane protein OmpA-like peptidoglycan-associated protein
VRRIGFKQQQATEQSGIWLSIGDLMAVLLLLFAFLFVLAMLQLQDKIDKSEKTRVFVIQALQQQLNAKGIHAEVNPETGDVSLTESILFDFNQTTLKPEGKEFLKTFVPIYSSIIFSSETISHEIVRVIVEGHTSSAGSFSHNMRLSALRAISVSQFIDSLSFPNKAKFNQKLMVAGRGEVEANQGFDEQKDRFVKFRFQFRGVDVKSLLKSILNKTPLELEAQ